MNRDTGAVIRSDIVDASAPLPIDGLGYLNGKVYIQPYLTNELLVWDPTNHVALPPLAVAVTVYGGLTGAADKNVLYATNLDGNIDKLNPATGAVLATFAPGGGFFSGLAYVNDELIGSFYDTSGDAYVLNPDTGAVLGNLTLGGTGSVPALGGDGVGNNGTHTAVLAAGQVVAGQDFGNHDIGPTVVSVIPTRTTITDANVGVPAWPWDPPTLAGLEVRITYSGPMSLGITPTVTFAPAVASTLTFDAAHSWWVSDTTYKAAFDVADANVYVPHVGIVVTGAKDAAGNLQTPYSGTDDFSIDTLTTPVTVLSVTPSVTTVTDTNVGTAGDPGNPNAGFAVRIAYSAAMNTSSAPSLTFTPDVASTLTFNAAQSWWINAYAYKAAFNVADANVSVAGISVAVAGARDAAGYDQAHYHSPDFFSIDTTTAAPLGERRQRDAKPDAGQRPERGVEHVPGAAPVRQADADRQHPGDDLHTELVRHSALPPRTELVDQR